MTRSVGSAEAAGRVFDFRSSLIATLDTNADLAALEPMPDEVSLGAHDAEPVSADGADDPQWIVWPDAAEESRWADSEALDWAMAAQILGWRA
jgi:hypothetical protein